VRQVRNREPRLYMDNALAGNAIAQDEEVARKDLPFEFMLNALRLRDGFALQDFTDRTGCRSDCPQPSANHGIDHGIFEPIP
jgi:coproporphyrinogen III oxidase-like Fe-S oxidoreductase